MYEIINKSIKVLTERVANGLTTPDEALKFTQAALNLAHVLSILKQNAKL